MVRWLAVILISLVLVGCGESEKVAEEKPAGPPPYGTPASPAQRAAIIAVSKNFIQSLETGNVSLFCSSAYVPPRLGSCPAVAEQTFAPIRDSKTDPSQSFAKIKNELDRAKIGVKGNQAKTTLASGDQQSLVFIAGRWRLDISR